MVFGAAQQVVQGKDAAFQGFSGIPVLPSMGGTGESPLKGHQDDDEPGASLGLLSLEERRLWWEITNV